MDSSRFTPLYALHDSNPEWRQQYGAQPVTEDQAFWMQQEGYGIFWTPNLCNGPRRTSNLSEIRYWYCELDGDKEAQLNRIIAAPLLPSLVVESRNGYHVYWAAVGPVTQANWRRIVRWGIVPALGADPKSTDPVRLLRVPGYLHLKDPNEPWEVGIVWDKPYRYTEQQMLSGFPDRSPARLRATSAAPNPNSSNFWERVAALDCAEALAKLNGHWAVNGEVFVLRECANGNLNIFREDASGLYGTGCFVDRHGRLGNVDGGASIAAWLAWYGHSWRTVADVLREVFPQLGECVEEKEEEAGSTAGHEETADAAGSTY